MRFEKISKTQYIKDGIERLGAEYEDIRLPRRATKYSAGYDFFALEGFKLYPGESIKTPTGVRAKLDNDKFLLIAPRSSLGFKYRLQLDNTVGIIDADYYNSDNEGHIWIKITNDSRDGQILKVNTGDAIAQGIILPFFTTDDDEVEKLMFAKDIEVIGNVHDNPELLYNSGGAKHDH